MENKSNDFYRKKFQLKAGEVYYDEKSGISVGIKKFDDQNNSKKIEIDYIFGFSDGSYVESSFFFDDRDNSGRFWEAPKFGAKFRLLWLRSDIENRFVEFEIVQKPADS